MIQDFLGKDTVLPISGKFQSVKGIDTVLQDIQILIGTVPGERVMRPEYGCGLYTRLWDNIDDVVVSGVLDIRDAINQYEPRVTLDNVSSTADRSTGLITFVISFTIVDTNNSMNLVFPFQTQIT